MSTEMDRFSNIVIKMRAIDNGFLLWAEEVDVDCLEVFCKDIKEVCKITNMIFEENLEDTKNFLKLRGVA